MIKNGIHSFKAKALDGVEGGDSGTLVLRDGTWWHFFLLYHWHLQLLRRQVERRNDS